MDENYGQSPNSITAGRTRKRRDFPADSSPSGEEGTMVERAIRTAEKMRGVAQPGDKGEETPQSTTAQRTRFTKPPKPDTSAGGGKLGKVSPEEQRGQSISQALLKAASMVPNSSMSGTLRGLLSGASVGLDIGTALDKYRRGKLDETAATAAMKMSPEQSAGVDVNLQDAQYLWDQTGGKRDGQQRRYTRRVRELQGEDYSQGMNA